MNAAADRVRTTTPPETRGSRRRLPNGKEHAMSENYAALPDRDGGLRRGTPLQDCRAPRPRLDLTLRWREMDSNLYGAFPVKWCFSVYCQFFVRRCVQVRLACSAGDSPAGVKKSEPRSSDSGGDGNRTFEAYRQDLPRGEHESPGCIKRERIVASKKVAPRAEPTSEGRRQHEQPNTGPIRLFTSAGWKRRHGDKDMLSNWRSPPRPGEKSLEQGRPYNRRHRGSQIGR